jgi:hypothetical protein
MGWTPPLLNGIDVPNWSCYPPANKKKESTMNNLSRVGVDLAKNIFQLHGVDRTETSTWCRRLNRDNWIKVLLNKVEPGCEIGMEACTGAQHWVRLRHDTDYHPELAAA